MSDDEAGYCKPPKKHQFKKGKSGNPRGRPRKTDQKPKNPSDAEILKKIYNETVVVGEQEMTKRELEFRVLQKKAMSGHVPSMKLLDERSTKAGLTGGKAKRQGVLVMPPKQSLEEWKKKAGKNQAQYRENRRDDKASE